MGTGRRPGYRWNGLDETILEHVSSPEEHVIERTRSRELSWSLREASVVPAIARSQQHGALLAASARAKVLASVGPVDPFVQEHQHPVQRHASGSNGAAHDHRRVVSTRHGFDTASAQ